VYGLMDGLMKGECMDGWQDESLDGWMGDRFMESNMDG